MNKNSLINECQDMANSVDMPFDHRHRALFSTMLDSVVTPSKKVSISRIFIENTRYISAKEISKAIKLIRISSGGQVRGKEEAIKFIQDLYMTELKKILQVANINIKYNLES